MCRCSVGLNSVPASSILKLCYVIIRVVSPCNLIHACHFHLDHAVNHYQFTFNIKCYHFFTLHRDAVFEWCLNRSHCFAQSAAKLRCWEPMCFVVLSYALILLLEWWDGVQGSTVIPRLTKITRSGITFVSRKIR